jgi:inhibitor of cysteine peptidase
LTTVALSIADNGRVVVLKVGDAIALSLPSNPTSGYRWAPDGPLGDGVTVETDKYEKESNAVGSGGMQTWIVVARRDGKSDVSFKYWRPWAGEDSVIERFGVQLHIEK